MIIVKPAQSLIATTVYIYNPLIDGSPLRKLVWNINLDFCKSIFWTVSLLIFIDIHTYTYILIISMYALMFTNLLLCINIHLCN